MNDDGTGVERLVSDPTGDVTYGSYSADGKRIIFTGPSATLHQSIYTYDIASKRVSGPVGQTNSPCQWGRISRGGKYLLYTALRRPTGAPGGPYVIVQDLVTKQMVAIGKGCEPEFTPDGKQVVYVHLKQGDTHSDLIAYTITTGLKTRLTNLNGFPYCPRVSPDGKWIVFAITSDKHQANGWEIYLMPFAPLAPATQLTHNNFEDVNPDIS
jgi:Tol biopolymer transport system component